MIPSKEIEIITVDIKNISRNLSFKYFTNKNIAFTITINQINTIKYIV